MALKIRSWISKYSQIFTNNHLPNINLQTAKRKRKTTQIRFRLVDQEEEKQTQNKIRNIKQ